MNGTFAGLSCESLSVTINRTVSFGYVPIESEVVAEVVVSRKIAEELRAKLDSGAMAEITLEDGPNYRMEAVMRPASYDSAEIPSRHDPSRPLRVRMTIRGELYVPITVTP